MFVKLRQLGWPTGITWNNGEKARLICSRQSVTATINAYHSIRVFQVRYLLCTLPYKYAQNTLFKTAHLIQNLHLWPTDAAKRQHWKEDPISFFWTCHIVSTYQLLRSAFHAKISKWHVSSPKLPFVADRRHQKATLKGWSDFFLLNLPCSLYFNHLFRSADHSKISLPPHLSYHHATVLHI